MCTEVAEERGNLWNWFGKDTVWLQYYMKNVKEEGVQNNEEHYGSWFYRFHWDTDTGCREET